MNSQMIGVSLLIWTVTIASIMAATFIGNMIHKYIGRDTDKHTRFYLLAVSSYLVSLFIAGVIV